jgi:type I restriction enzyme R subunit
MSKFFTESDVEQAALDWLAGLGWQTAFGPEVVDSERGGDFGRVVLEVRLRQALERLNPNVPADALEEAFRKLTRPDLPSLVASNHLVHKFLVEGVPVEYQRPDGSLGGDLVRVLDFDNPENNDFLAVNQFTVVEDRHERRPDIVLFVNGLPLAVIELKNPADEDATIWSAFNQLQTYKQEIPSLFAFNEALVISDGIEARIGTISADRERFAPWRTIEGEKLADTKLPQLQVMLEGGFEKRRFLDLIRYFIVFEDAGGGVLIKKMAGYHQYHAVNRAVEATVQAGGTARRADRPGPGQPLRAPFGGDGRQGDGRLHEPADLRRTVQRHRPPSPRLAP